MFRDSERPTCRSSSGLAVPSRQAASPGTWRLSGSGCLIHSFRLRATLVATCSAYRYERKTRQRSSTWTLSRCTEILRQRPPPMRSPRHSRASSPAEACLGFDHGIDALAFGTPQKVIDAVIRRLSHSSMKAENWLPTSRRSGHHLCSCQARGLEPAFTSRTDGQRSNARSSRNQLA